MKEQSIVTKWTLGIGIVLLIYGFLAKLIPVNFFWESNSIGWYFILFGLIGLLVQGIKKGREEKKNTLLNKIGIGFICLVFLVLLISVIVMPNTDAYKVAKRFLRNNDEIKGEVGKVTGFGLFPTGGFSIQEDSKGEYGEANINLIVKGEKAYKIVSVVVFKDYDKEWEVINLEY